MKTSMYFKYTSRSLLRGGQRTILAIFCVAVGVMAVVSLQLVGFMLQNSLTTNVRANNGGDIALNASGAPLKPDDLAFFTKLKKSGTLTNYTALMSASGSLSATAHSLQTFGVEAVDPANFPLVSQPDFAQPGNGTFTRLLGRNQVVVTQSFLQRYHKHLGDLLTVYTKTATGSGQTLNVRLAGVITNTGMFAQASNLLLISAQDYLAAAPTALHNYNSVNMTTANQAQTDAATRAINAHFPLTATATATEMLKSQQSSIDTLNKFLEVAGLLALLIGGVGIVNTMQVLLSRRKTEIAMLKTTGYRRRDLYLLFGLEAGLLGLAGGIVGAAAATGMSYIVHGLMQNLGLNITFSLNATIIIGGVVIGGATALIFGLLPIVQAANIRPLNVIREQEKQLASSFKLTFLLVIALSILFCLLATIILKNDLTLGILATYGTLIFLLALSGFFGLVVLIVSKLPVTERFQSRQILLVLTGLVLSAPAFLVLPIFGIGLVAVSLLGLVIGFLPCTWKVNITLALRNLGRRRARTTTTMLALFIGIFSIGLVIALGQDVQTNLSSSLARNTPYNLVATTSGQDTSTLHTRLNSLPGLTSSREDIFTTARPDSINGQSLQQALPTGQDRLPAVAFLSQIEADTPAQNAPPLKISQGRDLNASDAGTNHIIISELLTNGPHMDLKVGDTITYAGADGKTSRTATIVGVIARTSSSATLSKILAPVALVKALSPANPNTNPVFTRKMAPAQSKHTSSVSSEAATVFYMKVAPAQMNAALDALGRIVPNASVQNLTDATASFTQQLNSMLDVLIAVASLSVLAAIIIIANTVALSMLERRRELGILKAVGYTSSTVL
ncbi:MAG: ABC transporter permease, partial [Ktedonobacteraceae bacterium]